MKVVIQIPCQNDAQTLPELIRSLPRNLRGASHVECLVVDDGSTDGTSDAARRAGVRHILRFEAPRRRGIAFAAGMEEALRMGADAVVTVSPRMKYGRGAVEDTAQPVLRGQAPVAVACRTASPESREIKSTLASLLVRAFGGPAIPDPASGLFACNKAAAIDLSHSPETLFAMRAVFRALNRGARPAYVPVWAESAGDGGESLADLARTLRTVLFLRSVYRPRNLYLIPGLAVIAAGLLGLRVTAQHALMEDRQMLVPMMLCVVMGGVLAAFFGYLAQRVANTRFYMEETLRRVKAMEYRSGAERPERHDREGRHGRPDRPGRRDGRERFERRPRRDERGAGPDVGRAPAPDREHEQHQQRREREEPQPRRYEEPQPRREEPPVRRHEEHDEEPEGGPRNIMSLLNTPPPDGEHAHRPGEHRRHRRRRGGRRFGQRPGGGQGGGGQQGGGGGQPQGGGGE